MLIIVERYLAIERQQLITTIEGWWDKYQVTLTQIENSRNTAAKTLNSYLSELGYVE